MANPPPDPTLEIPSSEDQSSLGSTQYSSSLPVFSPTGRGTPSPSYTGQPVSGRHPVYHGIRLRCGKWVSEIREPRKTTRIWLGTYPTPDMAATAYDVAALALKGPEARLNFPNMILSYPIPASTSASDIRAAAAEAAAARQEKHGPGPNAGPLMDPPVTNTAYSSSTRMASGKEFIDEEAILNMPNFLIGMAEGMMVSPPRMINTPSSDDSPGNSDAENLWSYH